MKKLDLSNVVAGVRKLGGIKQTLEHVQEAYSDAIASMFTAFIAGASAPVSIHGCVNSGSGSDYNISAGAIYHNGEVFDIAAFVGTAPGGQVPVLSLVTTYRTGDPVKYSDGSTFNTHSIRLYQWAFGASGSGLADFSAVVTLKSRINNEFLDVDGQIASAVAALVGSAPATLDVLGELADALGDDPNFATSMANQLAAKVFKNGDTMSGPLVMGNNKIAGLANGTANDDAVNFLQLSGKMSRNPQAGSADVNSVTDGLQSVSGAAPNAPAGTTNADGFIIIGLSDKTTGSNGDLVQIAIQCKGSSGGGQGTIYVRNYTFLTTTWSAWTQINT